jgi:polysaccharide biosynthesis/export protein
MTSRLLSILLVAVLAGSCAPEKPLDPRLSQTNLSSYRLDAGDRLRITVFGQMDLTGEFNVDSGGRVALPLIEPVEARGKTTEEFAHAVEDQLGHTLLRNPAVSVEITQYRPFFILGEVNRPGQYPYVNGLTVKTAAAIAGGFTYRASQNGVTIARKEGDGMLEGQAPIDAPVMPGDTITVAERIF